MFENLRLWFARKILPEGWRVHIETTPFMDGFDAATNLLLAEMMEAHSAQGGKPDDYLAAFLDGWRDGIIK